MRSVLLFIMVIAPCFAQFQFMEITFEGVGCESCIESLPSRVGRMRGVESATVDSKKGVLTIRLARQNRVRLEQVRDFVEQDGTRATKAVVRVSGELSRESGKLMLQPPGLPTNYEIDSGGAKLDTGVHVITGTATELKPPSGTIVIRTENPGQ